MDRLGGLLQKVLRHDDLPRSTDPLEGQYRLDLVAEEVAVLARDPRVNPAVSSVTSVELGDPLFIGEANSLLMAHSSAAI